MKTAHEKGAAFKLRFSVVLVAAGFGLVLGSCSGMAQGAGEDRLKALEEAVRALQLQNEQLRKELDQIKGAKPGSAAQAVVQPGAATVAAPEAKPKAASGDLRVFWKEGLNLESADGKTFKGKIGGRVQWDAAAFDAADEVEALVGEMSTATEFRRLRLHTEGTLDVGAKTFYKLEVDFAGGGVAAKDIWVGIEDIPVVGSIQAGHFKEPFGLEEMTSSRYTTFLERSSANEAFSTPSGRSDPRNAGVMARNTALDERMTWSAGAFSDVDDTGGGVIDSNYHLTARVTGLPYYEESGKRLIHIGAAGGLIEPDGETLRFRSRPEAHLAPRFVDTRAFEADRAYRMGAEAAAVFGPWSIQGEYMQTRVEAAAGDPSFDGFYVFGSWFVTGENRPYRRSAGAFDRVKPARNFAFGGGPGAWELAVRYSRLDLNDEMISGGRLQDITGAVNWYLNPNMRLMMNYIFADLERGPVEGENAHIFQTRLQFDF